MLNCPGCGAAVSADLPECEYCHRLLQTVACPKCMGMMFVGSRFCPHCGAAAQQVAEGEESHHACPRCKTDLLNITVGKMPMEECGRCGGLWVNVKSFDALCADTESQTAALGLQLPPVAELDTDVRYLPCPQCKNLMNRMQYAGRSGIIIQMCRPHGVWLDRDEIRQIVQFIRAGGLQRAREIEIEKLRYERAAATNQMRTPYLSDGSLDSSIAHADNAAMAIDLVSGLASIAGHFMK